MGQGLVDRDEERAREVARIPRTYRWWLHLGATSAAGLGVIAAAVVFLRDPRWTDLLVVPAMFVLSNMAEWRAHKYLLHKRRVPLHLLFDRHTPLHHTIFQYDDMAVRELRELGLVLIPSVGVIAIVLGTAPAAALVMWLWSWNAAMLVLASAAGYVLCYEWSHASYHLPPESFIGRLALVRVLREHHRRHHHKALMQKWNFNVTVPLWDWVKGTWASDEVVREATRASSDEALVRAEPDRAARR